LRVEAETKAGGKLIDMKEGGERHSGHGNNPPKKLASKAGSPTLKTFKLTHNQASRWQKLARLQSDDPREWRKRLDQLRRVQKQTVGLAKGTRGNAYGRVAKKPAHDAPTLASRFACSAR
jgi:hypothetical protein